MNTRPAILCAVAACAAASCDTRTPGPDGGPGGVIILEEPARIGIEAESAANDIAPFEVETAGGCSGGACLVLPEVWATKEELNPAFRTLDGAREVSLKSIADNPLGRSLVPNGTVELPFEVAKPGRYAVWVRAQFANSCANSFFLSIDEDAPVATDGDGRYDERAPETFGGTTYGRWLWFDRKVEGESLAFDLSAGAHVIRIFNREDGIRIDQVLLAEAPDGPLDPYEPVGIENSPPPSPAPPPTGGARGEGGRDEAAPAAKTGRRGKPVGRAS